MYAARQAATGTVVGVTWWLVLLEGIAALIVGLLLVFSPALTTVILVQILGFYWIVSGILALVSLFVDRTMWGWKLFMGILGILAGIVVIRHPLWSAALVTTFIVVYLAVQAVIIGAIKLYQAFRGGGWGMGALGVLNLVIGLYLLFNPFGAALALPWVIGIFAIIGGVVAIVGSFKVKNAAEVSFAGL